MSLTSLTFNKINCFLQNNKIKIKFNAAKDKTNVTSKIKYQYRTLHTPIYIRTQNSTGYAQYESDKTKWIYSNWQNIQLSSSGTTLLSFDTTIPYLEYDAVLGYEIRAIDDINNSYSESAFSNLLTTFFNGNNSFQISSLSLIQSEIQKISCQLNFIDYGLVKPANLKTIDYEDSTQLNQLKKYLTAAEGVLENTEYKISCYVSSSQSSFGEEIQLPYNFNLSDRVIGKYNIEIPLSENINIDLTYYIWVRLNITNNNNYISISERTLLSNFKLLQPESDPLTIKKNGIQSGVNRKNTYQVGTGIFNHTNGVADKNGKSDLADSIALMDTHTKENSNAPVNEPSIGFYDNDFNKIQAIASKNIQNKNIFYFDSSNASGFGLMQENNILYHTTESSDETINKTTLSSTSNMIQKSDLPKNIFNKYCYSKNSTEWLEISLNSNIGKNYLVSIYVYPSVDADFSLMVDRAIFLDKGGKTRKIYKNKWNLCNWLVRLDTQDIPFSFSSESEGTYFASYFLAYDVTSVYSKENYSTTGSINENQMSYIIESFEQQVQDENTPLVLKDYVFKSISDEDSTVPKDHSSLETIYGIATDSKYGHIKLYNNIDMTIDDDKSTLSTEEIRKNFDKKANVNHANKNGEIIGIASDDKYGHVSIATRNNSHLTSYCNKNNPKIPAYIYYGQNDIPSEGVDLNSSSYCQQPGTYSFIGGNYTKTNFPSDFFNVSPFAYGFVLETKLGYNYYGSQFLYQTATNKIWYRCIKGYNSFSPWMRIVTSEISGNNSIENNDPIAKINPATNEIPYVEDGNWTLSVGNNHANSSNCKFHRVGKICQIFGWMTLTEALNSNYVFSGFPFTSVDNYQFLNITFQGGKGSAPEWNNKGNLYLNLSGKLAYMSSESNGLTTLGNAYEWGRVNTIVRVNGSYMIKYS